MCLIHWLFLWLAAACVEMVGGGQCQPITKWRGLRLSVYSIAIMMSSPGCEPSSITLERRERMVVVKLMMIKLMIQCFTVISQNTDTKTALSSLQSMITHELVLHWFNWINQFETVHRLKITTLTKIGGFHWGKTWKKSVIYQKNTYKMISFHHTQWIIQVTLIRT